MKILCVADHKDPLVYSVNVRERFKDIDFILGAGDLPLDYYEFIISSLNKPLYFVFGNHNLKRLPLFKPREDSRGSYPSIFTPNKQLYFGSVYCGDKVIYLKKKNLILAGLGGSRKYNDGGNQFTEWEMMLKIFRMTPRLIFNRIFRGRYLDILLTHASPRALHDKPDRCHVGFKAFLWFMRRFKPRYLIHGHVHLYNLNAKRISRYLDTTVINAYDHIVIDTEKELI